MSERNRHKRQILNQSPDMTCFVLNIGWTNPAFRLRLSSIPQERNTDKMSVLGVMTTA